MGKYFKVGFLLSILAGILSVVIYFICMGVIVSNKNYGLTPIKVEQVAGIVVTTKVKPTVKDKEEYIQKTFVTSNEEIETIVKDLNNIVDMQRTFIEVKKPKGGTITKFTISYKDKKVKVFNFEDKFIKIKNKYYSFKSNFKYKKFNLKSY